MTIEPSVGQLVVLGMSTAAFAVAGVASMLRRGEVSRLLSVVGLLLGGVVLVWHLVDRGSPLPLGDNFDTLLTLALLLAASLLYLQIRRPVAALDWFVLPLVVVMLVGAGLLGRLEPHGYVEGAWHWVHRASAYGGAVAFALAAAGGAMYVIAARKLRNKDLASPMLGSLERLEHLIMTGVTLGFALLTVGAVTGFIEIFANGRSTPVAKVALALAAWVVYAVVLHAPINPSLRGRKAAMLSIFGFLLMAGTVVAVLLLPEVER
jgi:ABC-type uncharacterized transport system permease subunit